MRKVVVLLLFLPFELLAASATNQPITCVTAKALADADGASVPASTGTLNLETTAGMAKNQMSIILNVTWGTSTAFAGYCEESTDGTIWGKVAGCSDAYPSVCKQRTYSWAKADWLDGKIVQHVPVAAKYARCQWWDAATGSGTVTYCINRLDQ